MDLDQMGVVVCLIRSAWNLKELFIEASTELNQEQVSSYLKLLDCTTSPLSKLHQVKLANISGFDPELEFIRFLLFCSPSLVKMTILEHPQLESAAALEVARKLLQFGQPLAVCLISRALHQKMFLMSLALLCSYNIYCSKNVYRHWIKLHLV
ncbi:hypothetical protein P3S67_016049 [Capsicum chacoense]